MDSRRKQNLPHKDKGRQGSGLGTQDREVSCVTFLSPERILLVQGDQVGQEGGGRQGPERGRSQTRLRVMAAVSGA